MATDRCNKDGGNLERGEKEINKRWLEIECVKSWIRIQVVRSCCFVWSSHCEFLTVNRAEGTRKETAKSLAATSESSCKKKNIHVQKHFHKRIRELVAIFRQSLFDSIRRVSVLVRIFEFNAIIQRLRLLCATRREEVRKCWLEPTVSSLRF